MSRSYTLEDYQFGKKNFYASEPESQADGLFCNLRFRGRVPKNQMKCVNLGWS